MRARRAMILLIVALAICATGVRAEEATVTHYDPSCGFFIMKLAGDAGFGLFERRSGPTPAVGHVMEGDMDGGPEIDVLNRTAGAASRLIHWASAATQAALIRNYPFQCTSRWQRRP